MATIPPVIADRRALPGAVRRPRFQRRQGMEGEAVPGRKAIGYMPVYVPRELIHAAGMLSVGILGGGDQLEVIQGDAYYQSYICRIPRSTIELGLTRPPRLPRRHAVPVDLRRDPQPVRACGSSCSRTSTSATSTSRRTTWIRSAARSTSSELEVLREDLGKLRGAPITDAELNASIRVFNDNRAAIRDLYDVPRGEALAGADLRGLSGAARRHGAAARGAHAARPRVHRRRRRAAAAEARQRAHRADRRVLRAAAARR